MRAEIAVTLRQLDRWLRPERVQLPVKQQPARARIHRDPLGTVLNFVQVVIGENVAGNPRWGHSQQGHYFWLGGTDHPNG